jgi:hypothetical protein
MKYIRDIYIHQTAIHPMSMFDVRTAPVLNGLATEYAVFDKVCIPTSLYLF